MKPSAFLRTSQWNKLVTISGWMVATITLLCSYLLVSRQPPIWQCQQLQPLHGYADSSPVQKNFAELCTDELNSIASVEGAIQAKIYEFRDEPKEDFRNPCEDNAAACTSNCTRPISDNISDRVRQLLMAINLMLTPEQRAAILRMAQSIPENDVIFLSASSSNHYNEMQAMFHNLHTVVYPRLKTMHFVLVDIGLTKEERKMTEKNCKCQVVSFPAKVFPAHVYDNHCYSWKPLIIRAIIEKARKLLVYSDTSIRWKDHVTQILARAEDRGLQLFRHNTSARIPLHTMKQTLDYMGEEACALDPFPELEASVSIYKKDPFVLRAVLDPWARCALEVSCICPVLPELVLSCRGRFLNHRCHRFDQSALGIITAKLFSTDISKFISLQTDAYMEIQRDSTMSSYFNVS